ncbi:Rieske (2Fe-2S) protein [Lyngbya confervoides]|uniref:Rieske (2Fe-2S) protein n=1 Tax=Lyngbya confervoides BDU141951 TaxID=1574623 RepID=A0ABD4T4D4_9CYAN|nr:Rieske (2Fe-2S) protein [Lyngbya confervoides]MCM1983450.1 Rieske (2Fe-2S) protein [Lyngbya confervoides BDU141951]
MGWEKAVAVSELPENSRKVVTLKGNKILLLHQQGEIYAVDNRCPHMKLPLKNGKVTAEGAIICPFHRSAFELSTGQVAHWTPWPPVVGNLMAMASQPKALPTYATKVEDGSIFVNL